MIVATANTEDAQQKVTKIAAAVQSGAFDAPVEIAAWKVRTILFEGTPKRWTGETRKSWKVTKLGPGARRVHNDNKVMLFLEAGTGNAGTTTSSGGFIFPKTKKYLYIPLKQSAMVWVKGMKFGVDYVLARKVRGIKAIKLVERTRPKAAEILNEEMKHFLERAIK